MIQPWAETPVFNYVVSIQGREFIVTLTRNRLSRWEDLTGKTLADQIQDDISDSILAVEISDSIFAKALEMAEKEKREEAQTGTFQKPEGETAHDMEEMDRLFEAFFWKEINHRLPDPLIVSP